jgi:hypothetical protein
MEQCGVKSKVSEYGGGGRSFALLQEILCILRVGVLLKENKTGNMRETKTGRTWYLQM